MTETNTERPRYVLGVDPGSTTGLSVVAFSEDGGAVAIAAQTQLPWEEATFWALSRLRKMAEDLAEGRFSAAACACEKFTVNAQTAQRGQGPAEDALGMNGAVRSHCLGVGVELGPLETPGSAKRLFTYDVLKALGLFAPNMVHANDATRQACLLANKRGWLTNRALGVAALQ